MIHFKEERNHQSYISEKLANRSKSSRDIFSSASKNIDAFVLQQYGVENFDNVIAEVLQLDVDVEQEYLN